jgi:S1-C subfamily serine protease
MMRRSTSGLGAVLCATLFSGCSLFFPALRSPTPVDAAPFAPVVERTGGSVAKLLSTTCGGAPIAGSGIVVAPDLVLTAVHVVGGARQVSLRVADAAPVLADVVGIDPAKDTALVRTETALDVPVLGLATDATAPGTTVAALGYPLGESVLRTEFARITSVTDSAIVNGGPVQDLVTVDATLRPGSSGGPAVDVQGTVRGMVVAAIGGRGGRDSAQTVALAIPPASLARSVAEWRDRSAATPAACTGDASSPPAGGLRLAWATDADAAEFVHTLWLLGRSINAGQVQSSYQLLTSQRRTTEGGQDGWAATVAAQRWTELEVLTAAHTGNTATVHVRLRTEGDGGCRVQASDITLELVSGTWLVGADEPAGDATACG